MVVVEDVWMMGVLSVSLTVMVTGIGCEKDQPVDETSAASQESAEASGESTGGATDQAKAAIPEVGAACRQTSRELVDLEAKQMWKRVQQDCIPLVGKTKCRVQLSKGLTQKAYRTCHQVYCPAFGEGGPSICEKSADEALKARPDGMAWQEFYQHVLAHDYDWAEPTSDALMEYQKNLERGRDQKPDVTSKDDLEDTKAEMMAVWFARSLSMVWQANQRAANAE